MAARFKLNSAGFKEILNSPAVAAELMRRAEAAAAAAKASAPRDSGGYADSIHTERATTDRAVARVVADAPHSLVVESRTRNLGKALDAMGGG